MALPEDFKTLNSRGLETYTKKIKARRKTLTQAQYDALSVADKNKDIVYFITDGAPSMLDLFYPIGSYYETSNTSFNPNTTWGGTWVKDSVGRVTVSQDTSQTEFNTVGKTGGEKTHKLTIAELAKHTHTYKNSDDPTGVTIYDVRMATTFSNTGSLVYGGNGGTYDSSTGVGKTGSDTPHNNLQPYVVVIRWHRTA